MQSSARDIRLPESGPTAIAALAGEALGQPSGERTLAQSTLLPLAG